MNKVFTTLTVLFEPPFWVLVFTRACGGKFQSCKVPFGAEPKDPEVYQFLQQQWHTLAFSPMLKVKKQTEKPLNPKRLQRIVKQQTQQTGMGTKAQQAVKLQMEQQKQSRKLRSKEEKAREKDLAFQLHREKRKQKHRGH